MRSLVRWNPFQEMIALQNAMERLFDESVFTRPAMRPWNVALDVAENDEAYIIKASLPGVDPDDLDITLEEDVLTIQGETKSDETVKESDYHLRERRYGSFFRSIRLPSSVDADKIEATYEHGVLTLTVPKAEEAKPKKIAVKAA